MNFRIGKGYDIHRTGPGKDIILGGIRINAGFSLVGHSDADVLLHAITDALLGSIAAHDIGHYFPPSDPENRNRNSADFFIFAALLVGNQGYRISNIDTNIIAEKPRIGPHREAIVKNIAELLKVEETQISVKARTNEQLGPVGRGEAIAAEAVVLIEKI
jgi:2-C-methyl-D-erythritol 2,4-cyclodiphosphate synthase